MAVTVTSQPSRLLSLPPELRNEIYQLLLVEDEPIEIRYRSRKDSACGPRQRKASPSIPGIVITCRQTRREATPLYYGLNIFKFVPGYDASPGKLRRWLDRRRTDVDTYIKHFLVEFLIWQPHNPGSSELKMDAEMHLHVRGQGEMKIEFGAAFEDECIHGLDGLLVELAEEEQESREYGTTTVLDVLVAFDEKMLPYLQSSDRIVVDFCRTCGKRYYES